MVVLTSNKQKRNLSSRYNRNRNPLDAALHYNMGMNPLEADNRWYLNEQLALVRKCPKIAGTPH
jgi:hypothetical protein